MGKRRSKVAVFCAVVLCLLYLYQAIESEFSLKNISYECRENFEWQTPPLTSEEQHNLQGILNQPFTYLSQGTQSYVFLSRDQRYVLKFFKFQELRPSSYHHLLTAFPFLTSYCQQQEHSARRKLDRLFSGYQLAYEQDRENSGIFYAHLGPTDFLKQQVIVSDRFGFHHVVFLDDVAFIVQEKAVTARVVISDLLSKGDLEAAKLCFTKIIDLCVSEYKKGLYDSDHNVMYNTGFTGDKVIRIDVGRLCRDESFKDPENFREDLCKIGLKRIDGWMQRHFPEYRNDMKNDIQEKLSGYLRDPI
jgi:hypothetical protein